MSETVQVVQDRVQREAAVVEQLLVEVRRVIVGQKYLLERMAIGLLTRGLRLATGKGSGERPKWRGRSVREHPRQGIPMCHLHP